GIPKTMDNDILWVWQSFGFLSAVEEARKDIMQLFTEVTSNPRIGVIQLFGSSSGFVVSHAALGSNVCDLVLLPELNFNMVDVCKFMEEKLYSRKTQGEIGKDISMPYGLIVMAETAIPTDYKKYIDKQYVGLTPDEKRALKYFDSNNRRVMGQTPDELRSAGLKIVKNVLERHIQSAMGEGIINPLENDQELRHNRPADSYWLNYRVFTNEPRHLIRSMGPTVSDVAYGIRLGTMAVDMALAGYTDCMVSQWLTEYVVVPLKLVILGRKQMPKGGIFWKTVITKTGQIKMKSLSL
ncbi:MAG: 6-phosphofructokinase, partial [Bacteroidales bacterium]|nr:6-phosphofructokinase [Bacteroidales bacterium]